jgi:hypothetical protein
VQQPHHTRDGGPDSPSVDSSLEELNDLVNKSP